MSQKRFINPVAVVIGVLAIVLLVLTLVNSRSVENRKKAAIEAQMVHQQQLEQLDRSKVYALMDNMNVVRDAAQRYSQQHNGSFPTKLDYTQRWMPDTLLNPWTGLTGNASSWVDVSTSSESLYGPGVVCYRGEPDGSSYLITGTGRSGPIQYALSCSRSR